METQKTGRTTDSEVVRQKKLVASIAACLGKILKFWKLCQKKKTKPLEA